MSTPTKSDGTPFTFTLVLMQMCALVQGNVFYGRRVGDENPLRRPYWFTSNPENTKFYGEIMYTEHLCPMYLLNLHNPRTIDLLLGVTRNSGLEPHQVGIKVVNTPEDMETALHDLDGRSAISIVYDTSTYKVCRRSVDTDDKLVDFLRKYLPDINKELNNLSEAPVQENVTVTGFYVPEGMDGHHEEIWCCYDYDVHTIAESNVITAEPATTPPPRKRMSYRDRYNSPPKRPHFGN